MRTVHLLIVCSLFFCTVAFAQVLKNGVRQDTLAMVDSWPVTTQDLFMRIELMPFEAKNSDRDFQSVKRKAVESLVGERLLALAAPARLDSSEWRFRITTRVLQEMFARDEMYKREIQERSSITEHEVRSQLHPYLSRKELLVVHPPTALQAREFSAEWHRRRSGGESNSAILAKSGFQRDTLFISLGSIDQPLEQAAFRLRDTLDVSGPVESSLFGTVVVALIGEGANPDASAKSAPEQEKAVQDILQQRKESALAALFVDNILHGQRMEADTAVFWGVTWRLRELILGDTTARKVHGGFRYTPDDIYRLLVEFHLQLDVPIAHGTFGVLPLGDFCESLFYYDFAIPSLSRTSFAAVFFGILRAVVEAKMVAQESFRRGYQNNEDVRHEVTVWTEYWRSRFVEFSLTDTVTFRGWEPDWSLWRYHTALVESTCFLSVQEILLSDSIGALNAFHLLERGFDMDSLARVRTLRNEWRDHGGRSGWFRFTDEPELAGKLMMMSVGETRGPVRLREGTPRGEADYAVLRLLGRRYAANSAVIDSLREQEVKRIRLAHQQATIDHSLGQMAQGHRIQFFYDRISRADVGDVNMFTRHLIGFGGKMNASPLLVPQWGWVDEWKNLQTKVP